MDSQFLNYLPFEIPNSIAEFHANRSENKSSHKMNYLCFIEIHSHIHDMNNRQMYILVR